MVSLPSNGRTSQKQGSRVFLSYLIVFLLSDRFGEAANGERSSSALKSYSKIYKFNELSRLLNITVKQASLFFSPYFVLKYRIDRLLQAGELAAHMIEEGRMDGNIDQVQGVIEFAEGALHSSESLRRPVLFLAEDASGTRTLSTWNGARIRPMFVPGHC